MLNYLLPLAYQPSQTFSKSKRHGQHSGRLPCLSPIYHSRLKCQRKHVCMREDMQHLRNTSEAQYRLIGYKDVTCQYITNFIAITSLPSSLSLTPINKGLHFLSKLWGRQPLLW